MLTVAQQALQHPTARAVTAIILHPTDPVADGAEATQTIADQLFDTGPGEPLPGLSFKAVIAAKSGVKINESLTQAGQLTGSSKFAVARVIVDADDEIAQTWPFLDWDGTAVETYLGAATKADGSPMLLEDFDLRTGLVDGVRAIGDGQFEITFADTRLNFDNEFSTEIYKGFGGAFPVRTEVAVPVGTYLDQDHDPAMDVTGSLTIEWFGHVEKLNSATNGPLTVFTPILMNGDNGLAGDPTVAVNYALMLNQTFGVFAFAGGLSVGGSSAILSSSRAVVLDEPTYFAVTVAPDGVSVTFYACRLNDESPALIGTATLPDPLEAGPLEGLQIGMSGGSHFVTYELRVWKATRTLEELREFSDGTIANATDFLEMLEMWRFSEGALLGLGPDYVFGEKGVINLRPVGDSAVWESSYTGDSPDLFPGSVAGQSKAVTYGRVSNVLLARIDTQHHVFGWDSVGTTDVVQLRMSGVPMVPEYDLVSVALGDFIFSASGNKITLTDPGVGTFAKFIPGQALPSRMGQRIEITNATNPENLGVFRVARDGVSADGLVLTVADRVLVSETAPAGTKIESYEPDVQYRIDLSRSVVVLNSDPIGDVTGDIVGRMPLSGTARWTELFELITAAPPDAADVVFDPELGFHLKPGSGKTRNQLFDELASSSFGWWIESPGPTYRLGTFAPPGAGPVTQVMDGPEFLDIDPLKSLKPFHRFSVGYARMWHTQATDGLATSVSAADAQRYAMEYTMELSTDPAVLLAFPTAVAHDDFQTLISFKPDAELFKAHAKSMLGVRTGGVGNQAKRHWFKLRFGSLWPSHILLNGEILVTWDDLTLGLVTTPCRVTSREIDTGDYSMTLEVHT